MTDDLQTLISVMARTPEWMRHDLSAKEPAIRTRAEEALAVIIASALRKRKDYPLEAM
jgi:hypothetical protein